MPPVERILVIKHGALGDFLLATGAFQAIRRHHAGAEITLLTTRAYAEFGRATGWFDRVWIDPKPRAWRIAAWLGLVRRLRRAGFARVYDLQHSDRTHAYFRLLGGARPEWSGIAPGCSHPHANPGRDAMHTLEREAEQLAMAGIDAVPPPDVSWLDADIARFGLGDGFALLVPGGSAHRPEKRWPAVNYAALARQLAGRGIAPVLIGAAAERAEIAAIAAACPEAIDLCDKTALAEIAALARRAAVAVGNDTGPMHLIALACAPVVVLYSAASEPAQTAPRGPSVTVLRRPSLDDLTVEAVVAALPPLPPPRSRS